MDRPPVVDVNSAGPEQLQQLVGVGRAEAEAILAHRQRLPGGFFQCIHDLSRVLGLREDFLELNQGRLACCPLVPLCCNPTSSSSSSSSSVSSNPVPPAAATTTTTTASTADTSKDSNCQQTAGSAITPSLNHCCSQRSSGEPGPAVSSVEATSVPTSSASQQTDRSKNARESEINSIASSVRKLLRGSTDSCHRYRGCLDCGVGSGDLSDCGSDMDSSSEEECMEEEEEDEECETILAATGQAATAALIAAADKPLMKRKSDMVVDTKAEDNPGKKPCRTLEVFGQTVQAPPADVSLDSGIAEGEGLESSGDVTTLSQSIRSPVPSSPCTPAAALVEVERRLAAKVVHPPQNLDQWLAMFQTWSHAERLLALDQLMEVCEPRQIRHVMGVIEPQFQRDFISLLPKELALYVLDFLEPRDLLRAAQTCRNWRILAEDNLLWREKCRESGIEDIKEVLGKRRLRNALLSLSSCPSPGDGASPPSSQHHHHSNNGASTENVVHPSPWKAAYMTHHKIEMNWRHRPVRTPKVLKGHDDHVITCLQFSGNRVVSGSDDNTLKVWSATTGKCLRTLVGHTGGVWSSQMSGNIIISGSTDRTLKVWNADTGNCIHTLYGHTSTVRCMHLHGSRVVSGSRDATLRLWDIETGQCLHVLIGHVAAVRCVQYNGRLVVSGAYDYMVKVWNPEREECLHTLQGHTNRVYSLQFDGVHVVSGSLDTSIRVWDVETGACKHMLMGHQSLTSGMELRNNILVSGNADSTVKVWDILNGQCLQTLAGPNKHQSAVTCLQFNNKFVITSSDDGTVKLWDLRTGDFLRNLVSLESGGSGGVVWRIRASATKLVCAVGSRNGTEETKLVVLDFEVEPK